MRSATKTSTQDGQTASTGGESPAVRQHEDFAQIIQAYNQVTVKLQQSHELLRLQVEKLQEQLASKDVQLQRSKRLAALGEMAAGIAHEVRNPLAAIQLYAGMIVEDLEQAHLPQTRETATKIVGAVRGLDAVVRDVLLFAREMTPRPRTLAVAEILQRAVTACQADIERQGVTVQIEAPEELQLSADGELLQQALVNLVRNAVEAMSDNPPGKPRVLRLSAGRQDGAAPGRRLEVRDTGPGIGAQEIERIFNPFFTTRATGTGLGLAIVHRIVDAHGGTITAGNHDGGGAVFVMKFLIHDS